MNLRRTTTAVLAAGCLALAACSSSDTSTKSDAPTSSSTTPSGTPTSTPTSTSTSTSTPTNSSSSPSGAQTGAAGLAAIVVQRSEVPSTFKPEAPDKSDSSDAELLACVGAKSTKSDEQATVYSDDFTGDTGSISSQVTRFGSQASVDSDVAIFRSPKIKSCFVAALRRQASADKSGPKFVSADIEVTPGTNGGPSNVVATTVARIVAEMNGTQVTVYINSVYITGPTLEVELDFTGYSARFDSTLATTLASAVAKRAAAA